MAITSNSDPNFIKNHTNFIQQQITNIAEKHHLHKSSHEVNIDKIKMPLMFSISSEEMFQISLLTNNKITWIRASTNEKKKITKA